MPSPPPPPHPAQADVYSCSTKRASCWCWRYSSNISFLWKKSEKIQTYLQPSLSTMREATTTTKTTTNPCLSLLCWYQIRSDQACFGWCISLATCFVGNNPFTHSFIHSFIHSICALICKKNAWATFTTQDGEQHEYIYIRSCWEFERLVCVCVCVGVPFSMWLFFLWLRVVVGIVRMSHWWDTLARTRQIWQHMHGKDTTLPTWIVFLFFRAGWFSLRVLPFVIPINFFKVNRFENLIDSPRCLFFNMPNILPGMHGHLTKYVHIT